MPKSSPLWNLEYKPATHLRHKQSPPHSLPASTSASGAFPPVVSLSWLLLNSFPLTLFLCPYSLPHIIAQSKQLLALFEILSTKINLNKCKDLGRQRKKNIMRVMEEQMEKGNKRETKRMSVQLSIRIALSHCLFLLCTHTYKHGLMYVHILLKQSLVLKKFNPLGIRGN